MKTLRHLVVACIALGATLSVASATLTTNCIPKTYNGHHDIVSQELCADSDYIENPIAPWDGYRGVANLAFGKNTMFYPIRFCAVYDTLTFQRNQTGDVALSCLAEPGKGEFNMDCGIQLEAYAAVRDMEDYDFRHLEPIWSGWGDIAQVGFDDFADLHSGADNPFPPSEKFGEEYRISDSVSPVPNLPPLDPVDLVLTIVQTLIKFNPAVVIKYWVHDFKVEAGSLQLRTTDLDTGVMYTDRADCAHFVGPGGTNLGTSLHIGGTWWTRDTNDISPLHYTIAAGDPSFTYALVQLVLRKPSLKFKPDLSFSGQFFEGQPILRALPDALLEALTFTTPEDGYYLVQWDDTVLVSAQLGWPLDLVIYTNEITVSPQVPVSRRLLHPSPFQLTATVRNLSSTSGMTNGFRVDLIRPDLSYLYTPNGNSVNTAYFLSQEVGPLPPMGSTNVTFLLSANLPPDNVDSTNNFKKRFQLNIVPKCFTEEPLNCHSNNTVEFEVEFANRADCYVSLTTREATPSYRVGEPTWFRYDVYNRGYLKKEAVYRFLANGALLWETPWWAMYSSGGLAWRPQKVGTNLISFEAVVDGDAYPADNMVTMVVTNVALPQPAKAGCLSGQVTAASVGSPIRNAKVLLAPVGTSEFSTMCFLATTDVNGCYQINYIPANGWYTAHFKAQVETTNATSYISVATNVFVVGGTGPANPVTLNVALPTVWRAELAIASHDISVTCAPPPPSPQYQTNTLFAAVTNIGLTAASNVSVVFYEIWPTQELAIGTNTLSLIQTASQAVASVPWRPSLPITTNYLVYVLVDPDQLVEEYYRTNNYAAQRLAVGTTNRVPSVTITPFPNAGDYWGASKTLSWSATDLDGDPLHFEFWLQLPSSAWTRLASLNDPSRSWTWNTTGPGDDTNYCLELRTSDGPAWVTNRSGSFGIDNTSPIIHALGITNAGTLTTNMDITFTNDSSDNLSGIASYVWNFGDGLPVTNPSPSHAFLSTGDHTVCLTVTDNAGNQTSSNCTASLKPRPQAAIDHVIPDAVYRGGMVLMQGHASDAGGALVGYEWRSTISGLLDQGSLSGPNADLSFSTDLLPWGSHTLELRVWNLDGLTNEPVASADLLVGMPPDWPMFHLNIEHTASTYSEIYPTNRPPSGNVYSNAWSYPTSGEIGEVYSSPAVANLDGNFRNGLETVVGSADGHLYALGWWGSLLWQFPSDTNVGAIHTSPACVDTDKDGATWEHVVFGSDDGHLYVLNTSDGSLFARFPDSGDGLGFAIRSSPVVADINYDGTNEVVFGCNDNGVYCLTFPDCQPLWTNWTGGPVDSSPAVAELDGNYEDGAEVVVGSTDWNVYWLSAAGGTLWTFPTFGAVHSSPAIDDVNSDGLCEVVVGSDDGHVYVLSGLGTQLALYPDAALNQGNAIGAVRSSPAIARLTGYFPSFNQIAVGSDDGNLYILSYVTNGLGQCYLATLQFTLGDQVRSSPAIARIDRSIDYPEVVVGVTLTNGTGKVVAVTAERGGQVLWQYPCGPVNSSPAVAELNHSGQMEIVFGTTNGQVQCLMALYGANAGGPYTVYEGAFLTSLTGSNSTGPGVLNYYWDLNGDGVFDDAIGQEPFPFSCRWESNGDYVVSLLVSNSGFADIAQAHVAVLDRSPVISLSGPTNLQEDQVGTFNATITSSGPDTIIRYEWDWNYTGGVFRGTTGTNSQNHAWTTAGAYTVAARAVDQDSAGPIATRSVQVRLKDTDGDGVPNIYDNCLTNSNPAQADCDGDGIGDACDTADNGAPILTCPPAITLEQTSAQGAAVAITSVFAANGTNLLSVGAVNVMAVDHCCSNAPSFSVSGALTNYPPGQTLVTFIAADDAANRSTGTLAVIVRDTTPPAVTLTSPTNGTTLASAVTMPVAFTVTDTGDPNPVILLRLDGQPIQSSIPPALLIAGPHEVEVNALDAAGNVGRATASFTLQARRLRVKAWGDNTHGQTNVPAGLRYARAISAGANHSLCLKDDGLVLAWGDNSAGQTNVPPTLKNFVAVSAGSNHSLALDQNGTVVAWGDNSCGQTNVPPAASSVVAISAGATHSLALLADGRVVAWGDNTCGQTNVPSGLSDMVTVEAGGYHNLALTKYGTVLAWGNNDRGQTNVPLDLVNVVAVAGGKYHSLALRQDGTLVAWGQWSSGNPVQVPAALSNIVAIAAGKTGNDHDLVVMADGTAVDWSETNQVQLGFTNVAAVAVGGRHDLALVGGELLPPEPLRFTAISWFPGLVELEVAGEPGSSFQIEVSSDLKVWTLLETVTVFTGSHSYVDSAPLAECRFYRLIGE